MGGVFSSVSRFMSNKRQPDEEDAVFVIHPLRSPRNQGFDVRNPMANHKWNTRIEEEHETKRTPRSTCYFCENKSSKSSSSKSSKKEQAYFIKQPSVDANFQIKELINTTQPLKSSNSLQVEQEYFIKQQQLSPNIKLKEEDSFTRKPPLPKPAACMRTFQDEKRALNMLRESNRYSQIPENLRGLNMIINLPPAIRPISRDKMANVISELKSINKNRLTKNPANMIKNQVGKDPSQCDVGEDINGNEFYKYRATVHNLQKNQPTKTPFLTKSNVQDSQKEQKQVDRCNQQISNIKTWVHDVNVVGLPETIYNLNHNTSVDAQH